MFHTGWNSFTRSLGNRWALPVRDYQLMPLPEASDRHCVSHLSGRALYHSKKSQLRTLCAVFLCLLVTILASFGVVHLIIVILGHAGYAGSATRFQPFFSTEQARSAADATRDVVPIPCHSHNDYWRSNPLFDAISAGCTSIEADIWLISNDTELYVGHDRGSLSEGRTLRALYLDPIAKLLDETARNDTDIIDSQEGIFYTAPKQTLVLLLDFKTKGETILHHVQEQIEPLRKSGSLSFSNGTDFITRAVTIVATGNVPYDLITQTNIHRDVFFDAPLDELHSSTIEHKSRSGMGQKQARPRDWNANNSFYASTSFPHNFGRVWLGELSPSQLNLLRGQIREAHLRGLQVRYWDTPAWPISLRNNIWRVLLEEGADVLNVDDLRTAAFVDWRSVQHDWYNG